MSQFTLENILRILYTRNGSTPLPVIEEQDIGMLQIYSMVG